MDASMYLRGVVIGFSIAAPVGPIGVLCIRRTLAAGRAAGLCSGLGAATADALYGAVASFGLTAISRLLLGGQGWLRLVGGAFLCYLGVKTLLARPTSEPAARGRPGGRGTASVGGRGLAAGGGHSTGPGIVHDRTGSAGILPAPVVDAGAGKMPALPVRFLLRQQLDNSRTVGAGLAAIYLSTLLLTLANPTTILSFVAVFAGLGVAAAHTGYGAAALLVGGVFSGSALWWLLLSSGVSLARRRFTPRSLGWVNVASGAIISAFGVAALSSLLL